MIIVQQVFNGPDIRGFATINTNNKESFLITYCDFNLSMRLNEPIIMTQIYPKYGPCGFHFGKIIATYEQTMRTRQREIVTIIGDVVYRLKWEEEKKHWWNQWKKTKLLEKEFLGYDGKQIE